MAHAGQFGSHYIQVVDRFYHALEWRYNDIKDNPNTAREQEILAKLLDVILADQVGHDTLLGNIEKALHLFQKSRHDSFTPNKYKEILRLMDVDEKGVEGYTPHLFGTVNFEIRHSA
jgi:hypothetical protein